MRNKRLLVLMVIAAAAAAAAFVPRELPTSASETGLLPAPRTAASAPASSRLGLPERETIGARGGELFSSRSWAPPRPSRPKAEPVAAPAPPPPPPMPYRVAGRVVYGDDARVVLARGESVLTVREGDLLDGGYRVESIVADRVTLRYAPLDLRQDLAIASTLPLASPPAASPPAASPPAAGLRPAQLRWDGPEQVRAGDPFKVALKVTSAHPLRASPLQLGYDAKLLEPLDVRAGGFFADGMFSYRVNPGGSIFVGASGKGAVPTDAELLVVTFRPIRPGATAELALSSLILQGASGRTIAHDRPAAFRTAIVQ